MTTKLTLLGQGLVMPDDATTRYWRLRYANPRPSLIGSDKLWPDGGGLADAESNDVVASEPTIPGMRSYLSFNEDDDQDEAVSALSRVAESWRADNNASGLPVHSHLPLPTPFVSELVRRLGDEGSPNALDSIVAQRAPGVREAVEQQLKKASATVRSPGENRSPWRSEHLERDMNQALTTVEQTPRAPSRQLSYTDPYGGSDVGMLPGGVTPPPPDDRDSGQEKAPQAKRKPAPPIPPSDKIFKPDLGRGGPVPTSDPPTRAPGRQFATQVSNGRPLVRCFGRRR